MRIPPTWRLWQQLYLMDQLLQVGSRHAWTQRQLSASVLVVAEVLWLCHY